jgi:hypothetical protein
MPYEMHWYIPNRVVYTQFTDHVSTEEFESVESAMKQFLAEGTPMIHHIVDFQMVESVSDKTWHSKKPLSQIELGRHGWAVLVNSKSAYIRFLTFTMAQAAGVRYREVNSFDDAILFLERADETLIASVFDTPS